MVSSVTPCVGAPLTSGALPVVSVESPSADVSPSDDVDTEQALPTSIKMASSAGPLCEILIDGSSSLDNHT
jgi:hypothetical protein